MIDTLVSQIIIELERHKNVSRVLVLLSGGLDSTLVLLATARACSLPVAGVNVRFSGCATTDERRYAEAAAACANTELYTLEVQTPSLLFEYPLTGFRPPLPTRELLFTSVWNCLRAALGGLEGTILLSGHGGDQLFGPPAGWLLRTSQPLAKSLAACGHSIWEVLAGYTRDHLPWSRSFLPPIHRGESEYEDWLSSFCGQVSIPSRQAALTALSALAWREHAHNMAAADVFYPLLTQSVIEIVIASIWSERLINGPRSFERAVLRHIGAPAAICDRNDKGMVAEPLLKCLAQADTSLAVLCPNLLNHGLHSLSGLSDLQARTCDWTVDIDEVWNAVALEKWLSAVRPDS